MRRSLYVLVLVACRSQPAETRAQPLPQPIVTATATATATARTPARVCEPTVTCGMWSKCQWLEFENADAGYDVFRIAGSDAGGWGSHYWRVHQCWPEDAGKKSCAIYCDATGACFDGFTPDSPCTASAAPRPAPYLCEVHGAECVTVPAKAP